MQFSKRLLSHRRATAPHNGLSEKHDRYGYICAPKAAQQYDPIRWLESSSGAPALRPESRTLIWARKFSRAARSKAFLIKWVRARQVVPLPSSRDAVLYAARTVCRGSGVHQAVKEGI